MSSLDFCRSLAIRVQSLATSIARKYSRFIRAMLVIGNFLRAHRLAFAFVRAAAESFGVVALDHLDHPRIALDLSLRQQRQVADLGRREERR